MCCPARPPASHARRSRPPMLLKGLRQQLACCQWLKVNCRPLGPRHAAILAARLPRAMSQLPLARASQWRHARITNAVCSPLRAIRHGHHRRGLVGGHHRRGLGSHQCRGLGGHRCRGLGSGHHCRGLEGHHRRGPWGRPRASACMRGRGVREAAAAWTLRSQGALAAPAQLQEYWTAQSTQHSTSSSRRRQLPPKIT
jgi:hypothetical protein